jgi:SAM-dependent methyltransferase
MGVQLFAKSLARAIPIAFDLRTIWRLFAVRPKNKIECVCCGETNLFRLFGLPPRLGAMCPKCGALERHRLVTIYLNRHVDLYKGKDILHFAPEFILRNKLEPTARTYVGCDLYPSQGVVSINIEKIDFPDKSFDLVLCSHVLEHVDDHKALRELKRVLRPSGKALLLFPIVEGWSQTYENPAVSTIADRIKHFGQEDHVRFFGADVRERIKDAGFKLEEFTATEPDVSELGLMRGDKIFVCTKVK